MNYTFILPVVALVLLLGAGCAPTEDSIDTTPRVKDSSYSESSQDASNLEASLDHANEGMEESDMSDEAQDSSSQPSSDSSDLDVQVSSTAPGTLSFSWEAPSDLTDEDSFRILLDDETNPTYPEQYQYWWERNNAIREHVWTDLPSGDWHVRLCLWNGSECRAYSDSVAVTIK